MIETRRLIEGQDYYVYYDVPLPNGIHGATVPDGNFYSIYINPRYPQSIREHAFFHELSHIILGHFWDETKTAEEKDAEAEAFIPEARRLYVEWKSDD